MTRPVIMASSLLLRQSCRRDRAEMASVPKHGDPVRDPLELVDPVGDVDDAHASGLEARYESEQDLRLAIGQRCGRLVQDEDTQVAAHRLGDLDQLLLAARQIARRACRDRCRDSSVGEDRFALRRAPRPCRRKPADAGSSPRNRFSRTV